MRRLDRRLDPRALLAVRADLLTYLLSSLLTFLRPHSTRRLDPCALLAVPTQPLEPRTRHELAMPHSLCSLVRLHTAARTPDSP